MVAVPTAQEGSCAPLGVAPVLGSCVGSPKILPITGISGDSIRGPPNYRRKIMIFFNIDDSKETDEVIGDAGVFEHPSYIEMSFWESLKVFFIPEVHHAAF